MRRRASPNGPQFSMPARASGQNTNYDHSKEPMSRMKSTLSYARNLFLFAASMSAVLLACSDTTEPSPTTQEDASIGDSATPDGRAPRNTSGVEGEGLSCDIKAVLQTTCWGCHGSRPANGAPYSLINRTDMLTIANEGQTRLQRSIARMRDDARPMPPSGTPAGQCAVQEAGACKTCTDMASDFAACIPLGGSGSQPNLCDAQKGPTFFVCAAQQCSKECGLSQMPGGTPDTPCDPKNGASCKSCLETKCKAEFEACK
jgi:hypothetical protein